MKSIRTLIAAGAVAAVLAGCAGSPAPAESEPADDTAPLYDSLPEEVRERGTLVFAGDSHPPYRIVGSDGEVTGIDADVQAALEGQLGVDIEIEIASGLPDILAGMLSGRYDAFNGPVRATPEREEDFDAIVWMTTVTSYVFLKENADRIKDSDDLCGLSIAGTSGSVTETQVQRLNEWCEEQGEEPNEFVGFADTNATVLAVESGRVDALGVTETAAIDIIEQTPDTYEYVRQTEEQGAGIDLMAMLTPKDNGLGEVFLKAFENLFESGEYAEIMEKWHLSEVSIEEPLLNPTSS